MALRPQTSESSNRDSNDYFSLRTRRPSATAVTTPDDFSGWSGPNTAKATPTLENPVPSTPNTPGGIMGRLRAFGKTGRRQTSELGSTTSGATHHDAVPEEIDIPKTPLQILLAGPLSSPPSSECPTLHIPPNTSVIISEEAQSGWTTLYRGHVASSSHDKALLEEVMPMWLLEYLLVNKVPALPVMKVSFVLLPYNKDPNGEYLPELLNTAQAKLTATRFLRVRKLTNHVQDKLEKIAAGRSTASNTPRSSMDARSTSSAPRNRDTENRPRAEEMFEILCNDVVLPLDMTLAAVRQFIWRQSAELVMHYRRRTPPSQ